MYHDYVVNCHIVLSSQDLTSKQASTDRLILSLLESSIDVNISKILRQLIKV